MRSRMNNQKVYEQPQTADALLSLKTTRFCVPD